MRVRSMQLLLCILVFVSSSSLWTVHPSVMNAASNAPDYLLKPEYTRTYPYGDGIGRIVKDKTLYFVDKQGKIIGTPKEKDISGASVFNQGITIASQCYYGSCDNRLMDQTGLSLSEAYFTIKLWNAENGLYQAATKSEILPWDDEHVLITYTLMNNKGQLIKGTEFNGSEELDNGLYKIRKSTIAKTDTIDIYGLMNDKGKVLIAPKYDEIRPFHDGIALVKKDNKYGYINEQGIEIVPPVYDRVDYQFNNGFATVQNGIIKGDPTTGTFGVVDRTGKLVLEPIYESIRIQDNGLFIVTSYTEGNSVIMDASGRVIYENKDLGFSDYSDGLAIAYLYSGSVYIDEKGNEVLRVSTPNPEVFIDGIALVNDGTSFIDKTGREVAELQHIAELRRTKYDNLSNFYDGIALVFKNGLIGYIDRSGKEIFAPQFTSADTVDTFSDDGLLSAYNQNYSQVIISKTGKMYDAFSPSDRKEGMTPVGKGGKWGFVDTNGNEIVQPIYDEVKRFNAGVALIRKNGKWGLVDIKGTEIVKPIYDVIEPFKEGLAMVKEKELYGFIDDSGNEVIAPQFEAADSFSDNRANVKIEGYWGYIINPIGDTKQNNSDNEIASWAKAEVTKAIDLGLIPLALQTRYGSNITREDFSALVVRFIEVREGKSIEDVLTARNIVFDPTWSVSNINDLPFGEQAVVTRRPIMAALAMGIVNGKGQAANGSIIFDPKGNITRQEAAVMLTRTAEFMEFKTAVGKSSFSDSSSIADWATQAVDWVYAKGVMQGVENGRFAPQQPYTRQQAFMTIYRLYQLQ